MDEATLQRLLYEHAAACWVSEDTTVCHQAHTMRGNRGRALYFRTRAVVLYDRVRDEINGGKRRPTMAGLRGEDAPQ